MSFFYIKALHIIFVVTWFSGMFYLGRLFIYTREAQDKPDIDKEILTKQLRLMTSRLYCAITLPSAILTLIFGGTLLTSFWPPMNWLIVKLVFVFFLYLYQVSLHMLFLQQKRGIFKYNSQQLRFWNEVPTIILVAVIMLVVVKSSLSALWGIIGLIVFVVILMSAIRLYKKLRKD